MQAQALMDVSDPAAARAAAQKRSARIIDYLSCHSTGRIIATHAARAAAVSPS